MGPFLYSKEREFTLLLPAMDIMEWGHSQYGQSAIDKRSSRRDSNSEPPKIPISDGSSWQNVLQSLRKLEHTTLQGTSTDLVKIALRALLSINSWLTVEISFAGLLPAKFAQGV